MKNNLEQFKLGDLFKFLYQAKQNKTSLSEKSQQQITLLLQALNNKGNHYNESVIESFFSFKGRKKIKEDLYPDELSSILDESIAILKERQGSFSLKKDILILFFKHLLEKETIKKLESFIKKLLKKKMLKGFQKCIQRLKKQNFTKKLQRFTKILLFSENEKNFKDFLKYHHYLEIEKETIQDIQKLINEFKKKQEKQIPTPTSVPFDLEYSFLKGDISILDKSKNCKNWPLLSYINLTNCFLSFHLEYTLLKSEIRWHNYRYYVKNQPLITDYNYDKLYRIFTFIAKLIGKNPFIKITEVEESNFLNKDYHSVPLKSMNNVYSLNELGEFHKKIKRKLLKYGSEKLEEEQPKESFLLQPKIDGVSIILYYKNGDFEKALTRGDFIYGENITANIQYLNDFPKTLSKKIDLVVRGEAYCSLKNFEILNSNRKEEEKFANPRNFVAGSIRLLDAKAFLSRKIEIFFYDYIFCSEDLLFQNDLEFFKFLKKEKFNILPDPYIKHHDNINLLEYKDLIFFKEVEKDPRLNCLIDGVVLKINEYALRDIIGFTYQKTNWAIAYKFESKKVQSILKSIDFSVSRYGEITPIGILEPVVISGTTVQRVSLANFKQLLKKDIRIGDFVEIEKAGEIIPHLTRVLKEKRNLENPQSFIIIPEECPSCKAILKKGDIRKWNLYLRCRNKQCEDPRKLRLERNVNKDISNSSLEICNTCSRSKTTRLFKYKRQIFSIVCENKLGSCKNPFYKEMKKLDVEFNIDCFLLREKIRFCDACGQENIIKKSWVSDFKNFLICETENCVRNFFLESVSKNKNPIKHIIEYSIEKWEEDIYLEKNNKLDLIRSKNSLGYICYTCRKQMGLMEILEKDKYRRICKNKNCEEKRINQLVHFASKEAMNIESLSKATIKFLYGNGLLKDFHDFYNLDYTAILEKFKGKGIGKIMLDKIKQNIEESKNEPWENLLYALGCEGLGKSILTILTEKYSSIEAIQSQNIEDFLKMEGIRNMAIKIYKFFKKSKNKKEIQLLKSAGLKTKKENLSSHIDIVQDAFFDKKNFVITGAIPGYTRNEIGNIIKKKGGIIQNTVNKKTHYLILGNEIGESKIKKAEKLSVSKLSYDNLKELLEIQ